MAPPAVDLDPYRAEIIQLISSQNTQDEVVRYLQDRYDISITRRTLVRRLKSWNISTQTPRVVDEDLENQIIEEFFHGLSDTQILRTLQNKGYTITLRGLVRIRKETLQLKRRLCTEEERQTANQKALDELTVELEKGVIEGYGRGLLHAHFQELGVHLARDRLFSIYRTLIPDAIECRTRNMQRHRGEYIVPGPNYVWSLDGYCKLAQYGVEVYAAIDAYSRFIIWLYVGISSRTAISVLRQYLDTVEELGQIPQFIRSDHGTETGMMANAHHQLHTVQEPDLEFQDCYLYGTSTTNQRIESWWNQLSKGLLFRWRVWSFRT